MCPNLWTALLAHPNLLKEIEFSLCLPSLYKTELANLWTSGKHQQFATSKSQLIWHRKKAGGGAWPGLTAWHSSGSWQLSAVLRRSQLWLQLEGRQQRPPPQWRARQPSSRTNGKFCRAHYRQQTLQMSSGVFSNIDQGKYRILTSETTGGLGGGPSSCQPQISTIIREKWLETDGTSSLSLNFTCTFSSGKS